MSDSLFRRLMKFEPDKDSSKLTEFVESLDKSDMLSLVTNRITNPDGTSALRYLLMGLSQKNSSQKKRLQIIEGTLKELQKRNRSAPNSVLSNFVCQIAIELEKFSTPHLIKICELCVEFVRNSTDASRVSWKDLLPKLLNILETRQEVDHNGTQMSGVEYKKRVIETICMCDWKPAVITTLTAMFKELHLNGEQLSEVVNKLCRSIEDLSADEIPPFVHQLLELCRERYANHVFVALRNYFYNNIYKFIRTTRQQTSDVDSVDILDNEDDLIKDCECNVLYHIEEAAKLGHGSIGQLLRFVKSLVNCPEFLIDPFFLAVLFILSSISTYEAQVTALFKSIFIRNVSEQEKKQDSAWLRTMIPKSCDMEETLFKLIQSRACENDKVMKGLINLSVSFLALSKRSGTQNPECLWKLGQIILVTLVQKHKQVAETVLRKLVDCIFSGQNIAQYTDCLRGLCDVATYTVTDNQSHLNRLVELIILIPGENAEQVIVAMVPIIRVSSRLRDSLISALRKALFHKERKTKEMAVTGFLKLLKYLNVKNLSNLSQCLSLREYSGPSVFSQISAEVHLSQPTNQGSSSSNEAICLEVVNILKRCFVQSSEVRVCLYEGLFEVVEHNPILGQNVLELLLNHFSGFYQSDETVLPPVDFAKAVTIEGHDAVLQEPLGHLLLIVSQVVIKVRNEPENDMNDSISYADKFSNILTSLIKRFIRCDLNHFELDEETNILDILPECLQRQQILYQIAAVYEALMAYVAFSWTYESTNEQGQTFESLFKVYNLIYEYIKNCKSNKKKDGAPKKDKIDGKRIAAAVFKPPETILNVNAVNRILSLLLCDHLDWANPESTAEIRTRRPLLRYALQAAVEAVNHVSKKQSKAAKVVKDCYQLGRILYTNCLLEYEKLKEFDLIVAVHVIECFLELFSFISTQHKSRLPHFLDKMNNVSRKSNLVNQLKPVVTKLQSMLEDVATDTDTIELYLKREATALTNCIVTVNFLLPVDDSYSRLVTDYLLEFAQKKTLPFAPVIKIYISHMLNMLLRCKTEVAYLDNMAVQICGIIGTYDDRKPEECQLNLSILNESSVFNTLPILCNTLICMLENCKWLLARLRSENIVKDFFVSSSMDSPARRSKLCENRETELVRQTGLCINIAQTIITISVPAGPCTDVVFSMLSRIFTTLTDISKYFTSVSDQHNHRYKVARFGKIVKLASFHLSSEIPDFIVYVEQATLKNEQQKHERILQNSKKQAQYIPRLTGDLENFTKCVDVLSSKCKDKDLAANLKITTVRDFRVNLKKVEEIMAKNNADDPEEENDEEEEEQEEEAQANPEPPRKKSRKS